MKMVIWESKELLEAIAVLLGEEQAPATITTIEDQQLHNRIERLVKRKMIKGATSCKNTTTSNTRE